MRSRAFIGGSSPYRPAAWIAAAFLAAGCATPKEPAEATKRGPAVPPDVHASGKPYPTLGHIERLDPRLDELIPTSARIEVLAQGFEWTEGPVWAPDRGEVLFSDIPRNSIFSWGEKEGLRLFLKPSGYTGKVSRKGEPGSNGLVLDREGRLVLCEHGDRRIARLEADGLTKTTLTDNFEGKRLNSPNDATFRPGTTDLYFTDPIYGLEKGAEDPRRELDFCGVFRLPSGGKPVLLTRELTRPNGVGFSPDGKVAYVANSDPKRAIWMAWDVTTDGGITRGRVFFDATDRVGKHKGLPDGLTVDAKGNLFAAGPGGVLVFAPDGTHLGTVATGEATANCTFGGDGSDLYITADMYLLRVRTGTRGQGF